MPVGQHELTLATVCKIDNGKIAEALNHELKQMVNDVCDRPGDRKVRKVTFDVELSPNFDRDSGVLDSINTEFKVKSRAPARKSIVYPMLATKEGTLLFNEHSPNDPRQGHLYANGAQPAPGSNERIDEDTGEVITD